MINNDSVVTAYDEHLTLVEWLQKVEVLLKNGGLKEITLNDEGSGYNKALFSLTLTFNDGSKIESNAMSLHSVNEALTNLGHDIDNESQRIDELEEYIDGVKNYKGFDITQTWDKTNCVRIGTDFSTEEMTLKRADDGIVLSDEDAEKAKEILSKAIKYGFIISADTAQYAYGTLVNALVNATTIFATFVLNLSSPSTLGFLVIYLELNDARWYYKCFSVQP